MRCARPPPHRYYKYGKLRYWIGQCGQIRVRTFLIFSIYYSTDGIFSSVCVCYVVKR